MGIPEIRVILPHVIVAADAIVLMLIIAFYRGHTLTAALSVAGLALAAVSLPVSFTDLPVQVTHLLVVDRYACFYTGLILAATAAVSVLSYGYLEKYEVAREEYYLLLLLAALGSMILVASSHFVSLFLGIEMLSVSLYALLAYHRSAERGIEAGVKYLVLAAVSSAFLLFGMALLYFELGTMEFAELAVRVQSADIGSAAFLAGTALIITGLGFKLAVVPFHMWTPDVYEGAPAPVTAFVATVSKGAVFALLLRYFGGMHMEMSGPLFQVFTVIAVASMLTGNLLALLQDNIKRILAYSSIAHLGYMLVAFLAAGDRAVTAVAFYLSAYVVTTLGAFGTIIVLSDSNGEAESLDHFRGLAWKRPWVTGVFTAMIFSLAGIPLTAGFIGKFYVLSAGVSSSLWLLVVTLVINSAIGIFYYLRIILVMFQNGKEGAPARPAAASVSLSGGMVLAALLFLLVWFGVYPGPLVELIQRMMVIY
jgi:NADH-quinone oxidoreductase subunit N